MCVVVVFFLMSFCELFPPQGGSETKTLTPKQCIIIDAGLESIKVREDLQTHTQRGRNHQRPIRWCYLLGFKTLKIVNVCGSEVKSD